MWITESCTGLVHVAQVLNICMAWQCGLDTSGIDLCQVEGGAEQASDRADVPFSARIAPSEKFAAVACAEADPPKDVAASHGP